MFDWNGLIQVSAGMIIFWSLVFALVLLLFYYLRFYLLLGRYKSTYKPADEWPKVSVVICARNEEVNLTRYLQSVLDQDYPDYEVVVVNDCSWDNTGDILEEFATRNKHLKIVTIKEDEYYQHGKKVALMMGIKGASNDLLILTDADCYPSSNQWLKKMVSGFSSGKEIVLGYGPYKREKGLLNTLIRFDAATIGMQYLSFGLAGRTYMGVGRNLAYRKQLFYKVKGFASHYHIPSGDDDLFVNEAANAGNVIVMADKDSFTYTDAKDTFKKWWRQKQRHLLTGKRYKTSHKFRLGLYIAAQWLFYAAFTAALVLQFQWMVVCGIFVFRLLIQMLIFNSCFRKLDEKGLLALLPFLEIFFLLFYPVITLARAMRRKTPWN
jgi:cellulose synthase/poly-beta-1,6-N-acetylglucosamine synthase-like glycosyltransferase